MQHVFRIPLRDPDAQRLQPGAHARHGAVVVRPLHIDGAREAAPPLVHMIGDIGHKVRVGPVALAHDAIFVVAIVGRAQPERIPFLKSGTGLLQCTDRALHLTVAVERRLQEVHVELHPERLEVEILLLA